jgi:hypothetical protein
MGRSKMIERHATPTKYERAPFMTIYRVKSDQESQLWIQINQDEQKPSWQRLGSLMEKAFSQFVSDDKFLEMCLRLASQNT